MVPHRLWRKLKIQFRSIILLFFSHLILKKTLFSRIKKLSQRILHKMVEFRHEISRKLWFTIGAIISWRCPISFEAKNYSLKKKLFSQVEKWFKWFFGKWHDIFILEIAKWISQFEREISKKKNSISNGNLVY